jgi:hypothetical protein
MTPEKALEIIDIYINEHRNKLLPDELAALLRGVEALRRDCDNRHKIGEHSEDTPLDARRELVMVVVGDSLGKKGVIAYGLDEIIKEAEGLVSTLKQAKEATN